MSVAQSGTITPREERRKTLPPPQAHRSAGTRLLIAIVVVLVILFGLVAWSRYHRSEQPPTAPLHQTGQLLQPGWSALT